MKRELLYPFFIECCKFTNDIFWKSIYEDLAYGITPYGTYIQKDFLTCNYKDKEFIYKIQKKDPKELYNDIYNLFRIKLSLMSRNEIIKKKNDINILQEQVYEEWTDIKKKNLKEVLIEKYAINMSTKHKLTITQTKYLMSLIFLSFVFKIITSNDIIMKNGKIESINGIEFEKGKINLKKSFYNTNYTMSPYIVLDKESLMSDEWNKYLNALRKI